MPTDFQYNSERTSETSSSETQSATISYTPQLENAFTVDEATKDLMISSTLEAIDSFDRPAMLSVLGSETTIFEDVFLGT